MATKITASLETAITPEDLTSQDHYLQFIPAKIHSNDKANIKPFFNDYILNKDGELSSVLRGRPLNGKIVEFKDHKAIVMKVPNTSKQVKADLMEDEDMSGEDGDNSHRYHVMFTHFEKFPNIKLIMDRPTLSNFMPFLFLEHLRITLVIAY